MTFVVFTCKPVIISTSEVCAPIMSNPPRLPMVTNGHQISNHLISSLYPKEEYIPKAPLHSHICTDTFPRTSLSDVYVFLFSFGLFIFLFSFSALDNLLFVFEKCCSHHLVGDGSCITLDLTFQCFTLSAAAP